MLHRHLEHSRPPVTWLCTGSLEISVRPFWAVGTSLAVSRRKTNTQRQGLREVWEEAGLEVRLTGLLGLYVDRLAIAMKRTTA